MPTITQLHETDLHSGHITKPRWSPDGRFLAVPTQSGSIAISDLDTERVAGRQDVREGGFHPRVAGTGEARSAIVMLPAADPAAAVRHLATRGIVADARPGHVRLSPFFYNVQDDHVAALEQLATHRDH